MSCFFSLCHPECLSGLAPQVWEDVRQIPAGNPISRSASRCHMPQASVSSPVECPFWPCPPTPQILRLF